MIAYLDSSVVLRHILKGDISIRHAFAVGSVVSSELLEIECRRVIHRCRLEGELTDDAVVAAMERLDAVLAGISLIGLSPKVKRRAMDAFPVSVKTLDALPLSSALALADATPEETVLVFTYDAAMNRCAKALGFQAPLAE